MDLLFGLNFDLLKSEHQRLSDLLSNDTSLDRQRRADSQRLFSQLDDLLNYSLEVLDHEAQRVLHENEIKLLAEHDEYKSLIEDEIIILKKKTEQIKIEMASYLFPKDERDSKACFVEIRAGTGGQEAAIFAADLLRMYTNFSLKLNWEASVSSISYTDLKGVREVFLYIKGKGAFGKLKFESGVHRVQRVPQTEGAGRIHTSTVTVAVMSEADEIDVKINQDQLRIDTYRSSGAGGQHVNTTDSAIRITHLPTGIVVTCQDERSQTKNKVKALKELRARILEAETQKADEARASERKSKVGTGGRSEKIRTYNFPQNRVTDHRIDFTLKKLDMVMDGDLVEILEALAMEQSAHQQVDEKLAYLFSKG